MTGREGLVAVSRRIGRLSGTCRDGITAGDDVSIRRRRFGIAVDKSLQQCQSAPFCRLFDHLEIRADLRRQAYRHDDFLRQQPCRWIRNTTHCRDGTAHIHLVVRTGPLDFLDSERRKSQCGWHSPLPQELNTSDQPTGAHQLSSPRAVGTGLCRSVESQHRQRLLRSKVRPSRFPQFLASPKTSLTFS